MKSTLVNRLVVRVKKSDSAFFYHILEGNEGVAAWSTLDGKKEDHYRDIELLFTSEFWQDVNRILEDLKDLVQVLQSEGK
jgi:hypothetical protein